MTRPEATRAWELYHQGDFPQAETLARAAIGAEPGNAQFISLLAAICQAQGRRAEAIDLYHVAIRLRPDHAEAHNNLGAALAQSGNIADAIRSFREAVRLDPRFSAAHNNLGNSLRQLRQFDDATKHLRQAIQLKPEYADAYFNLGLALAQKDQFVEAEAQFRQALRLNPAYHSARHHLGLALLRQEKLDEATACLEEAVHARPQHVDALNDLGYVRRKQGRYAEAMSCFDRALALQPDHPSSHHNRALLRLLLGDFQQGWPEYEWRWQCPEFSPVAFRQPLWSGDSLAGRTILLHAEQGAGDTIQFVRYAALLKQQGGTVLLACAKRLIPLLSTCPGIHRLVADGALQPAFDVHAPLASLPHRCGTTLANVPAPVPYLKPDPPLAEHWRKKLSSAPGFKVGVCWQGSPGYREDAYRSMPLACFAPLAGVEGVRLYSLQKGFGTEQLSQCNGRFAVTDLGSRLDETTGAFVETAAVIASLDLIITCDSALGHLAGALNRPVWIALPHVPDYRWMLGREDSPWYPSARLFRQKRLGCWDEVFARMAERLRSLAARAASA